MRYSRYAEPPSPLAHGPHASTLLHTGASQGQPGVDGFAGLGRCEHRRLAQHPWQRVALHSRRPSRRARVCRRRHTRNGNSRVGQRKRRSHSRRQLGLRARRASAVCRGMVLPRRRARHGTVHAHPAQSWEAFRADRTRAPLGPKAPLPRCARGPRVRSCHVQIMHRRSLAPLHRLHPASR